MAEQLCEDAKSQHSNPRVMPFCPDGNAGGFCEPWTKYGLNVAN